MVYYKFGQNIKCIVCETGSIQRVHNININCCMKFPVKDLLYSTSISPSSFKTYYICEFTHKSKLTWKCFISCLSRCRWLLEVNASPSLTASSQEDYELKYRLLEDTLHVVDMEGWYDVP